MNCNFIGFWVSKVFVSFSFFFTYKFFIYILFWILGSVWILIWIFFFNFVLSSCFIGFLVWKIFISIYFSFLWLKNCLDGFCVFWILEQKMFGFWKKKKKKVECELMQKFCKSMFRDQYFPNLTFWVFKKNCFVPYFGNWEIVLSTIVGIYVSPL